jgi:hypothetical protein
MVAACTDTPPCCTCSALPARNTQSTPVTPNCTMAQQADSGAAAQQLRDAAAQGNTAMSKPREHVTHVNQCRRVSSAQGALACYCAKNAACVRSYTCLCACRTGDAGHSVADSTPVSKAKATVAAHLCGVGDNASAFPQTAGLRD